MFIQIGVGVASKREAAKQEKRERIIEAAVRVFAQKGFYTANVKDVARAAGVADGTIYLYFKNKDDLLISLFEHKMKNILLRFEEELKDIDDPLEQLKTFIHVYFELIENDTELSGVFQVELRQSSKFLKDYHNQQFSNYLNMIARILDKGKAINFFRPEMDTNIAKIFIFGAIDEVARQWILGRDGKYSIKEAAEQTCDNIIKGLLAF